MRAVAALLVVVPLLAGCGNEYDDYCETVKENQTELTEIVTGGDRDALIRALPIYQELRDDAPDDITDEWQQVIRSIESLKTALDEAGVDASYDPEKPPEGVTQDQQNAIRAAADELASPATADAFEGVEQQARDVCQTPLTL